MKEVSKEEFFQALYQQCDTGKDIMPSIVRGSPYPYTSEWRNMRTRELFGKSEGYLVPGEGLARTRYLLACRSI